ncbi:hypothetical protein METBIDRAFT_10237 [Metschnikowia bicuspidata var. bicuspidata NRRL YB-4993]|uniref:Vacuolar ATPase assembly protein VMA22 n=1 Tax=Metschnikowia bicuspidata var. bicuspidata NRRL YB-4993 TaxID=869754 RepID=A0A1A0HIS0_9ASCO|nr:hypothetical protein METBIDRAFT_10237 [Metschnikowia bicuspidata var. bicuspidata NRRL YB-4993]OBA24054.1 hypothetical protein METBIDRAFT_10237 [Metschnikowia bicuspidata var. bicuspidata NRRL YB-4993]
MTDKPTETETAEAIASKLLRLDLEVENANVPSSISLSVSQCKAVNACNEKSEEVNASKAQDSSYREQAAALKTVACEDGALSENLSAGGDPNEYEIETQDAKTFRLLDLLNEYESLANDVFRVSFINGFLELSRANYYGSQRFDMDSIDRRPRGASAVVDTTQNSFRVRDLWKIYKERERKNKRNEKKSKSTEQDEEGTKDIIAGENGAQNTDKHKRGEIESDRKTQSIETEAVSSARKPLPDIRNRKQKHTSPEKRDLSDNTSQSLSSSDSEEAVLPPQDPVYQFGRMVPYQLRNAQTHFQNALVDSLRLLNLQREITLLVLDLEAAKIVSDKPEQPKKDRECLFQGQVSFHESNEYKKMRALENLEDHPSIYSQK